MANVGRFIQICGEIQTTDDLAIDGYVEGLVWSDGRVVTVGADAEVNGDIVARDITVFGQVVGSMIASGIVDVRDTARVTGRVVAESFVLAEGASFTGLVERQQIESLEHGQVERAVAQSQVADRGTQQVGNRSGTLPPEPRSTRVRQKAVR